MKKTGIVIGLISLVLVTAIISFAIAGYIFYTWDSDNRYKISFDSDKVNLDNVEKFNKIKNILESKYYESVDENKLLEGAISGMAYSLEDPYTVYFSKEQMAKFMEASEGSYVGIGVLITVDKDGLLTIVEPFEDSPAKEVGMIKGDKILKVDDKDVTAIRDENLIIKMIKGVENTKVKITVFRPSEGKSIDFNITRKKINVVNISSEVLSDNIGYIKIKMFDNDIAKNFEEHLKQLQNKGIKGLIIDVRGNPGGDYYEVVKIVDRLIPEGLIVYTEDKNKKRDEKKSDAKELNLPMSLLVNGNSASASEILAGALKDHNKATLVGTRTFGKGVVQAVLPLEDGSGLKVTIARYFTPSGVCIQGIGIQPNEEVKLDEKYQNVSISEIPREEDSQLNRAIEIIKEQISK